MLGGGFMAGEDAEGGTARKRQRVGEVEQQQQFVPGGGAGFGAAAAGAGGAHPFMSDGMDTLQEDPLGLLGAGGGDGGHGARRAAAAALQPLRPPCAAAPCRAALRAAGCGALHACSRC
jgi:hypothetical protein